MNASKEGAAAPEPEAVAARRLLIVVNRKARSGEADLTSVLETLAPLGKPRILAIDNPDEFPAKLEASCGDVEGVVVAGGDGTVNSALAALIRTGKPLGIIPLGTANDLARTLGVPTDPAAAAAVILNGRKRRVDVGSVNGRYFLNAAGIGFSARLHEDLTPRIKGLFGPFAYGIGALRMWRHYRPFSVLILGDELSVRRHVMQVTIANGRFYGGGMTAHEAARIDDARLDVVMVLPRPWWRHLYSVVRLKRGVYADDAPVVAERTAKFELITHRAKTVTTDGEPSTVTPASFSVLPLALEVYVPDEPA